MQPRGSRFRARIVTLVLVSGAAAPASGWLVEFPGQGDNDGRAHSVEFDADGNIVAGGQMPSHAAGAVKISKSGSVEWRTDGFDGWGGASAVAPNGDVAVVGAAAGGPGGSNVGVAILGGADGGVINQSTLDVVGNHWAQTVTADAAGYFVVGSSAGPPSGFGANGLFTINKYGAWTRSISTSTLAGQPGMGLVMDLAADGNGDVIAAGRSQGVVINQFGQPVYEDNRWIVAKLSGTDGAVLWQSVLDEGSLAIAVAVDANGDVIATGKLTPDGASDADFAVLKLSGADGSEIWRFLLDGGGMKDSANAVAIDSGGDVVVGGVLDLGPNDPLFGGIFGGEGVFTVVKLAGSDGSEIWQHRIDNDIDNAEGPLFAPGVRGQANGVALDPVGNVVAVGTLNATWLSSGSTQAREFIVAKLNAADGSVDWLQNIGDGEAFAVAVDDDATIAVAGWTMHERASGTTNDFAVLGLSDCIAGRSVQLSAERRLKLVATDRLAHTSAPGTAGDPTINGGKLILTEAGSMDDSIVDLPAANWTAVRSGFIYRDREQTHGPCSLVKIRRGKITAKCEGSNLDLVARLAPLDGMAVRFELGTGGAPFCMEFGGDLRRNDASDFQARDAPAPSRCLGR